MKIRISRAARGDLKDIWRFGADRWSIERADRYGVELMEAIGRLALNPFLAPVALGLDEGTRRLVSGSHVVIYVVRGEVLDVQRVLHQSRDAGRWVE